MSKLDRCDSKIFLRRFRMFFTFEKNQRWLIFSSLRLLLCFLVRCCLAIKLYFSSSGSARYKSLSDGLEAKCVRDLASCPSSSFHWNWNRKFWWHLSLLAVLFSERFCLCSFENFSFVILSSKKLWNGANITGIAFFLDETEVF